VRACTERIACWIEDGQWIHELVVPAPLESLRR
jgi:hypothetical protein